MPSSAAYLFIFSTKAASSPSLSQRASWRAMLLAEGSMIASMASLTEIFWPSVTLTVDSCPAFS